jgi:Asp/Glu/hydantoin racemase
MSIRIWHQSFTVLENLPAYAQALAAHFASVARVGTDVVMHGMHVQTYKTNYPGTDIRYAAVQALHSSQFVMGGLAAEEQGYDAYAISTIPDVALREVRSLIDIPVVGYGESAMLTSCMLGGRFGVLLFIPELVPQIADNVRRYGLEQRFASARHVGFQFNDVLAGFDNPAPLIERFEEAARALIRDGADVIIPGEAPLCVLLAKNKVSRVDDAPVIDALGANIKMAEALVDLKRICGVSTSRRGYYMERPPRERIAELLEFYGLAKLKPAQS